MAEFPELRTERWPVPPSAPPPRQLYDRPHTYGVAHDLERMRQGWSPPPRTPRTRTRARRGDSGKAWTLFRGRWANSDRSPVDVWHRIRCRSGHHDIRGGHQMQLGNRYVYVERRCIYCDASPPA